MAKAKPNDISILATELIASGGDEVAFNEAKTLQFRAGGVNLKIHFEAATQGFPLKVKVEVVDKIQTDVSVEIINGVPTKMIGPNSKTKSKTRILLSDSHLSKDNPTMHIFDRSGNNGFNLMIGASQTDRESLNIEFLLVVRPGDDRILNIPNLNGLQNKVPKFAQRHFECFQGS